MTVIERMARALCSAEWLASNGLEKVLYKDAGEAADRLWQDFVPAARAALEALREPSYSMALAAEDEGVVVGCCNIDVLSAKEVWSAMIDAALKESVS